MLTFGQGAVSSFDPKQKLIVTNIAKAKLKGANQGIPQMLYTRKCFEAQDVKKNETLFIRTIKVQLLWKTINPVQRMQNTSR